MPTSTSGAPAVAMFPVEDRDNTVRVVRVKLVVVDLEVIIANWVGWLTIASATSSSIEISAGGVACQRMRQPAAARIRELIGRLPHSAGRRTGPMRRLAAGEDDGSGTVPRRADVRPERCARTSAGGC